MMLSGSAGHVPDLLKPTIEILFVDLARLPLLLSRLSVASRLSLHQDEFYVVLDDRVRLIWLAEELRSISDFIRSIRNLVP